MTPRDAVLLLRLALGIAGLVAGFFLWGEFTDWIKAPVIAERDAALARERHEREAKEWLNGVLVKQAERESKVDKRLEGINRDLADLKKNDPAARGVLGTVLPDAVIRMSQYSKGGAIVRDTGSSPPAGNPASGSAERGDGGGRAEPQEPAVRGLGEVQQPSGLTGYLGQVWKRLQMKKPAEAGSK